MNTMFSPDFFAGNRAALRKLLQNDAPVVIAAHGLLQQSADTTFPFRQDSNFWYLTGIDEPDIILVLDGKHEYLLVPGRSSSRKAFDGEVDHAHLAKTSGITEILDAEDGWKRLDATLKKTGTVHTLAAPEAYIEQYGMYTNPARARLLQGLHARHPKLAVTDIRGHLGSLRSVKHPVEIQAIQKAVDITIDALQYVTDPTRLSEFSYEFEIENELTKKFRTNLSRGHAFSPIIASGQRAVTLHNINNNAEIFAHSLVVLDVGAEVSHYAADITRTVVYGQASQRQKAVHAAVLEVQEYALALLKPGVLLKEYEVQVETFLGGKLQELGLIDSIDRELVRQFYPHAASHFLGLDVHDVGDYSRPLEPGMVVTCEPGIYISTEGIGVRIEDDVLITATGNTVLSDALPRRLTA